MQYAQTNQCFILAAAAPAGGFCARVRFTKFTAKKTTKTV